MQIIELIGFPGSGKSYLCRFYKDNQQVKVLDNSGEDIELEGVRGHIKAFMKTPLLFMLIFFCIICRRCASWKNLKRIHLVQVRYLGLKEIKKQEIILVDEGPVHALYSALFGTKATAISQLFLFFIIMKLNRLVDIFLFLDITKKDCVANFKNRNSEKSRFGANAGEEVIQKFLLDDTYKYIIKRLKRGSIVKCISTECGIRYINRSLMESNRS